MPREGLQNTDLYRLIEEHLKRAEGPMTCVDLFEKADVRKVAKDVNHVSNALGYMWRRQYIKRQAAPHMIGIQAKFAYWFPRSARRVEPPVELVPRGRVKIPDTAPAFNVYENGRAVELDYPDFTITVRMKRVPNR